MKRMSEAERLAQARECLASGMPVKDWCPRRRRARADGVHVDQAAEAGANGRARACVRRGHGRVGRRQPRNRCPIVARVGVVVLAADRSPTGTQDYEKCRPRCGPVNNQHAYSTTRVVPAADQLPTCTHLMRQTTFPSGARGPSSPPRANQSYFRNALLDNYGHRCCVSGLAVEQLLVASHIKPWSESDPATERLSPENVLLLDALHDRAFDKGLMTIDLDLRVVVSPRVPRDEAGQSLLWRYAGHQISVPGRFKPRREFI